MSDANTVSLFISDYTNKDQCPPFCIHQVNNESANESDYSYNDSPLICRCLKEAVA